MELPFEFVERMKAELGEDAEAFFASYDLPARKGIRVNTLKISAEDFKKLSPFSLSPIEWEENGFYIEEEKPGKSLYHFAGLFYVQEPSAMSSAPLLNVKAGERVLDLCSAPGGKGTQLAQRMNGDGLIVLNEINFDRAKILSQNVERMGIKNAVVTCSSPDKLAKEFSGYFDKILVDAPCSGEGMFKKEPNAIPEWSVENVRNCAERQVGILENAYSMLRCGGSLAYSTCTFSREEDEEQIASFLSKHEDMKLIKSEKLYPHKLKGEGHFIALMQKGGDEQGAQLKLLVPTIKDNKLLSAYKDFENKVLNIQFKNLHLLGDNLYALPQDMPKISVQTLRAGVHLGEFIKGRFEPSHSLAMCLKDGECNSIEVDENTAKSYLAGNTFEYDNDISGWAVVTYQGYPLGWCKAVNGIAKNHFPKGLRNII